MAEDWLADVRKYVANADEAVVGAIVKYLGIALRNRDSSLVSFTDKKETDRVRNNFLKKKLGLTDDDATLDAAIAMVGDRMKEDRTKNRVTVYYLLAEHFGLLSIFGGAAGTGTAAALAAATGGGAGDGPASKDNETDAGEGSGTSSAAAPLAAAGLAGAGIGASAGAGSASAAPPPPPPPPTPTAAEPAAQVAATQTAYSGGGSEDGASRGMGWLPWLLLALLLLALIFFGLRYCSRQEAAAPVGSDVAVGETAAGSADANGAGLAGGAATAAAVPEGAGVIAADRAGKPMLTVYFDTGKSEVSNDLSTAASAVKAYLDSHAGATLAVSGFNDPSGNAAANAELSKTRAQNVKAAIEALGIAADKVVLEKPADTTAAAAGAGYAGARRVEVTVRD